MAKKPKYQNKVFGPLALLEDDAKAFRRKHPAPPEVLKLYGSKIDDKLLRLVVHPEELTDADAATWFPQLTAEFPDFVFSFMDAMRRKLKSKSKAEKLLHTFGAMAWQNEIDKILAGELGLDSNSLRTAREKLRKKRPDKKIKATSRNLTREQWQKEQDAIAAKAADCGAKLEKAGDEYRAHLRSALQQEKNLP